MAGNHLTLAVAGSRKTQGIVDECAAAPVSERILVLTYTTVNQLELRNRLATFAGDHPYIEVNGWFSFVISTFARPFLPHAFGGQRVHGFDFGSPPQQYAKVDTLTRYLNSAGEVRKVHLPQLAVRIEDESNGSGLRRLERMYDRIYIDEVQDLCGYDLEILKLLMASSIPVKMVGDVRQAILATNERERKNKKFMYMGIWKWFQAEEAAKRLLIEQRSETWRCRSEIAALADSLFSPEWGFDKTQSRNNLSTTHDGVFLIRSADVDAYMAEFAPLPLRTSIASAKRFAYLPMMNFGEAKGMGRERVLIFPTGAIEKFLAKGTPLDDRQAAPFYVAITRAEQSVALVIDKPGICTYPYWSPEK
ncbi:UvrD-helicase domain-containing protein [Gordonia sp. FQ]|uniref:UvrD-helicase domain-containing protein n=1 Tax=Gordonia sp. FQ TaxID=3446634 RepID=UPI003F839572